MPRPAPRYIDDSNIAVPELHYEWDDWKLQEMFESESDAFHERMAGLSYRATFAFTIATGEWIVHRYDKLSSDPEPLLHMEAMWAGVVDSRYVKYWEPQDEFWLGPIRGALRLGIIFSLEAMIDADGCADVALSADRASIIAQRVLPDPAPYLAWQDRVLARLEMLYPFKEDDPMGDVVPKEALDPDFDFQPEMTEDLVRRYLQSLDPTQNRFLATDAEILARKFPGVPYQFDLEQDRINRNDF